MSSGTDLIVNAALEEEKRVQACAAEVGKIMEHYNCVLSPQAIISNKGVRLTVDIIAKTAIVPPSKG